jgi:hypothetical protein
MRWNRRFWGLGAAVLLAVALTLLTTFASAASSDSAQHVRWDIIHLISGNITAGGQASAMAQNGGDTITLTGSGTFVAPGSGGESGAATGGGTWTASGGGSGTYEVTSLVSWVPANAQMGSPFNDLIDEGTATNGTAVLRISFSDGSTGVLTVGCHGPAAPPGILEGIATTKGFKTYYIVSPPSAGVDANRTLFHVR